MWSWQRLRKFIRGPRVFYLGFAIAAIVVCAALMRTSGHENLSCAHHDHAVLVFPEQDSLALAFHRVAALSDIASIGIENGGVRCKAAAMQTQCLGDLLAELSSPVGAKLWPLIAIILDGNGAEYVLMIGKQGQTALSSMKYLIAHHTTHLKKGLGVEIEVPAQWAGNLKPARLYLKLH